MVRNSLKTLNEKDGKLLVDALTHQNVENRVFGITEDDAKKLRRAIVRVKDKEIDVVVPEDDATDEEDTGIPESMEELGKERRLEHMRDSVIENYEEFAEEI